MVATEGEFMEPWYFHGLMTHGCVPSRKVRLRVLPPQEGRSAPKHVLARMDGFVARERLRAFDECWLVLDIDNWPDAQLRDVVHGAASKSWSVALSNPCFEVWLQLHFEPEAVGNTASEAKKRWRKLRLHHAGAEPWPFTEAQVRAAVNRSLAHRTAKWPAPTQSHVGSLVQRLVHPSPPRP